MNSSMFCATNVSVGCASAGAAPWWHRGAGGVRDGVHAIAGEESFCSHQIRRDAEVNEDCCVNGETLRRFHTSRSTIL